MSRCQYRYEIEGTERTCPRPTATDHDRCVFHLTPDERDAAGVDSSALRDAFLADIDSDDPSRREYVDIRLRELDLSATIVDASDVDHVAFREITVEGTLDLSGAILRHPIVIEDCRIDQLDATDVSFGMDVTIDGTTFGGSSTATCFRGRRGSFERGLQISDTRFGGSIEFAACDVREWLVFDGVSVAGRAHFPNVSFGTAQFVSTTFEDDVEFTDSDGERAIFERVRLDEPDGALDLSESSLGLLRVSPDSEFVCRLGNASVSAGRLDQPEDAVARYDLTDALVGDVDLDCDRDTFDRYRFYRTRFDGFPFTSYHEVLRENGWYLHEYVGDPETPDSIEGLEHTYLEAKRGASETGDGETASMFFVRELRYRRRRYAAHARTPRHSLPHRADAALHWVTNGFLDLIAGYGERPQRTAALSVAVIAGCALTYPATDGLTTGTELVTYASHGPSAVLDSLYFSIVTFATLGFGDVHPIGNIGRFLAASEGLVGAFLTAVFVFSLGRRVTR
jgi:hypothetical protein